MIVERTHTRRPSDAAARAFVWALWVTLFAGLVVSLVRYTFNLPQTEDWLLVPAITGNEPHFFSSLWAQNNEHRVPFPRLVLIVLLWIARGDFRAGMVLNIVLVSALAAAFISLARRVRGGRTAYADALFPLALMHAGHWENFFWAWQATQVIPTILPCVVLYRLVSDPWLARTRSAFVAGLCTMLLPLSGGNGLIFAPPLALWLLYTAFRRQRAGVQSIRFNAAVLLGSVVVTAGLTALYFVGYRRPDWVPPNGGPAASLAAAAQFEAMSVGPVARSSWTIAIAIVLVFVVATLAVAIPAVMRAQGEARQRASAVVFFFLTTLMFAAAVGWARSGTIAVYKQWPTRYALMATPSLLFGALIWLMYGRKISAVVTSTLAFGLFVLLPLNVQHGFWWRDWYRPGAAGIELALRSGTTAAELISEYSGHLNHNMPPKLLTQRMMMLKRARLGRWNGLANEAVAERDPEDIETKSAVSRVDVEVRYKRFNAQQVRLVWGVNGWHTNDVGPQSGTRLDKNLLLTPMSQRDSAFVATVKVPVGSTFNYGFLVKTGNRSEFRWETATDVAANRDIVLTRVPSVTDTSDSGPLLKQIISYKAPGAGAVTLVWGVDGWHTVPEAIRAGSAELKDKVMVTNMERRGDSFVAMIDVPAGAVLDYGYTISDRTGIRDLISPLWDEKRSTAPLVRSDTLRDRIRVRFPDEFRGAANNWPLWLAGAAAVVVLWPFFGIRFGRRRRHHSTRTVRLV